MIPDKAVEAAYDSQPYGADPVISKADIERLLEAAAPHLMAGALTAAALDFELSPHNSRAKMARHFNNAYVAKLRARAEDVREQE